MVFFRRWEVFSARGSTLDCDSLLPLWDSQPAAAPTTPVLSLALSTSPAPPPDSQAVPAKAAAGCTHSKPRNPQPHRAPCIFLIFLLIRHSKCPFPPSTNSTDAGCIKNLKPHSRMAVCKRTAAPFVLQLPKDVSVLGLAEIPPFHLPDQKPGGILRIRAH